MIGVKSIGVVLLAALTVTIALRTGVLDAEHLEHLSAAAAFAIGLFAALCTALVAFGARPGLASKVALALRRGRPTLLFDLDRSAPVRELPALVQRLLFALVFACLGVATIGSEAVARLATVPDDLTKKSRAEYCLPEDPKPQAAVAEPEVPPPPPVDQAGCALVKRAFALGYAKSLGSCAPKTAAPAPTAPADKAPVEICERRQLDEPFAHYAWRKVVEVAAGASPIDAAAGTVGELQTRFAFTRDLLADIRHSITGTPHASHHVFVNLPDPHPTSFLAHAFSGEVPCTNRFADLALWPRYTADTPPAIVLEHAFGQLLFATRFGTPASCSDYTIHWDAPRDICARLAANPSVVLDEHGALASIRDVLDRRRRQLALRSLALALGHEPTLPEPPPVRAVTSLSCLLVDGSSPLAASGREIVVDGQALALREVVTRTISPGGAGPLDAYVAWSLLLAGTTSGPARVELGSVDDDEPAASPESEVTKRAATLEPPGALDDPAFLLVSLEPLADHDPFPRASLARPVLARADLVDVYPFARHLHDFIDGFRRVYLPQRGRL